MSRMIRAAAPLALLLMAGGCATDYVSGRAPGFAGSGFAGDMGPGFDAPVQPGALFGTQNVASVEVFQQALAPHGRWVQSRWGMAFAPNAPAGWRPYVNGRWGANRFWISDDPWGWATDHYGRWGFDQAAGWVWVPGTQWGPSWAAWREADEVLGWAPIPPGVNWQVGTGFVGWNGFNDWNSWYGPSWVWVPRNVFWQPGFGGRILPWNSGVNFWRGSRWQQGPGWGWRAEVVNAGWGGGGWGGGGWNGLGWNAWGPGWGGWVPGWSSWGGGWGGWGGGWGSFHPGWGWGGGWGGWGGGWNRGWRGPQRGAPGSIGDRVGRDLYNARPGYPGGAPWAGGVGNRIGGAVGGSRYPAPSATYGGAVPYAGGAAPDRQASGAPAGGYPGAAAGQGYGASPGYRQGGRNYGYGGNRGYSYGGNRGYSYGGNRGYSSGGRGYSGGGISGRIGGAMRP